MSEITPPPPFPPPPAPPSPPAGTTQSSGPEGYPVDLVIDYQDRELNRMTTFFRMITVIPIMIIVAGLAAAGGAAAGDDAAVIGGMAGGLIVFPTALMLIFQEKYPRWWFDFNKELTKFLLRVGVYVLLIDDRYPSTTDDQSVHVTLDYPNVDGELSRFMPIIKWLLVLPHWFVLFFLWIGVFFGTIYAWFMVLFTGRYPSDVFGFVVGVQRWQLRVSAYAMLLVTDEYPPFRLES